MAKTSTPLHSRQVSGIYAKQIIFAHGNRPAATVTLHRTAARQATPLQIITRNNIAAITAALRFAARTQNINLLYGDTPGNYWRAYTPPGDEWQNYFQRQALGLNMTNIAAEDSAFWSFTDEGRALWDEAAAALRPIIPPTPNRGTDGLPQTHYTAGRILHILEWTTYTAGLTPDPPPATGPTWDAWPTVIRGSIWDAGATTWDDGASLWDWRDASIWDTPTPAEWDGNASIWDFR